MLQLPPRQKRLGPSDATYKRGSVQGVRRLLAAHKVSQLGSEFDGEADRPTQTVFHQANAVWFISFCHVFLTYRMYPGFEGVSPIPHEFEPFLSTPSSLNESGESKVQ